jgi:hypothetical protein
MSNPDTRNPKPETLSPYGLRNVALADKYEVPLGNGVSDCVGLDMVSCMCAFVFLSLSLARCVCVCACVCVCVCVCSCVRAFVYV